jgi:peptide/nickel transport system ATP-binding protein
MAGNQTLMEIRNLKKYFPHNNSLTDAIFGRQDYVQAVDGLSLDIRERDLTGVIGESGCGKSTLLKTLGRLLPPTEGEIYYRGDPITSFNRAQRLNFHRNVQIVFQDPFNSLNPKMSVRETLLEPLQIHGFDDHEERMHDVLERVELNPPDRFIDQMPANLSGGEKQRVSIARALILEPEVLLADEPVSMLDVSTQASILRLLRRLSTEFDIAILYISHDISTVAHLCEEINVMYLGRIIESGPTEEIVNDPKHPYTEALIDAVPIPNPHTNRKRTKLEGSTPDPINLGDGCRFRDRCPERMDVCEETPKTVRVANEHDAACHLYYDHEAGLEPEQKPTVLGETEQ